MNTPLGFDIVDAHHHYYESDDCFAYDSRQCVSAVAKASRQSSRSSTAG